jgi:hypothetical protein
MLLPLTYKSVVATMVFLILLFLTFYPYIQAETLTSIHQQTFDINKICKTADNQDFRKFKVVNFEKQRSAAQLYCLYGDYKKNSIVTLYYADKEGWLVEYTRNYKKDIGFFWPIYY